MLVNKKSMKQTTFWRCFLTADSFNGLKHLTEKVAAVASLIRVWVAVDHTVPTPLQRSTMLKISHWYFDQCLFIPPSRFQLLSKTSWANVFATYFFTYIHLMICLSSMVNLTAVMTLLWRPVYIAASKEYLRRIPIILMLLESAFH